MAIKTTSVSVPVFSMPCTHQGGRYTKSPLLHVPLKTGKRHASATFQDHVRFFRLVRTGLQYDVGRHVEHDEPEVLRGAFGLTGCTTRTPSPWQPGYATGTPSCTVTIAGSGGVSGLGIVGGLSP